MTIINLIRRYIHAHRETRAREAQESAQTLMWLTNLRARIAEAELKGSGK